MNYVKEDCVKEDCLKETYLKIRADKLDLQRLINKKKIENKKVKSVDINIKRFIKSFCQNQKITTLKEVDLSVDYTINELKKYKSKYFIDDTENMIDTLVRTIYLKKLLKEVETRLGPLLTKEYHTLFMSNTQSYYYKFQKEYSGYSILLDNQEHIFKEKKDILNRINRDRNMFYFLLEDNTKLYFEKRIQIVNKISRIQVV